MCNCQKMCRIPDIETQDGKYPQPIHAENCEDFKQEKFTVIEHDGARCIMNKNDGSDYLKQINLYEDPGEYKVSSVLLTIDQYERLPEFLGF